MGAGSRPSSTTLPSTAAPSPWPAGRTTRIPAGCQFFICLSRQPSLDGQYTAFGQLVGEESLETLSKIEHIEVTRGPYGEKSQPAKSLRIQSITLENAPHSPIQIHPLGGPTSGPGIASN